ncbi:MAG: hypothetical protein K1000chlam2_01202 [Chlamydiae bacterium]|nr:hypothetical protein [Chlamydiota bacterium]
MTIKNNLLKHSTPFPLQEVKPTRRSCCIYLIPIIGQILFLIDMFGSSSKSNKTLADNSYTQAPSASITPTTKKTNTLVTEGTSQPKPAPREIKTTTTPTPQKSAPKKISKLDSNVKKLNEEINKGEINFQNAFALIEETLPLISSQDKKTRSTLLELQTRLQNISKNDISDDKITKAYMGLCTMMLEIPSLKTEKDFKLTFEVLKEYVQLVDNRKGQKGIKELNTMVEKFAYQFEIAYDAFNEKSTKISVVAQGQKTPKLRPLSTNIPAAAKERTVVTQIQYKNARVLEKLSLKPHTFI